jgi:hypothetical protein
MIGSQQSGTRIPESVWREYHTVLARHGVPAKAAEWHTRRARHFVWQRDLIALRRTSPEDVSAYFQKVQSRPSLGEWRVNQMVDAIAFLCHDTLGLEWAADFDWSRWKVVAEGRMVDRLDTRARPPAPAPAPAPQVVECAPPDRFADGMTAEAVGKYPEDFERLRTEIRTLHYSIRTESAYAGWLARFIGFRRWRPPESLDAPDIQSYMEYLGTVRRVSAATQIQALCALVFFYKQVLRRPTRFATRSPPTFLKPGKTSARCRSCSATPTSRQHRSTLMC